MKYLIPSLLFLFFLANISNAQIAPKYSNEFLNIGAGARSLGMAGSVVSSTKGVTGIYWNPSTILQNNTDLQLGLMHSEYFAGVAKYDFAAAVHKIDDNNAIGAGFVRFAVDDIPNTLDLIDTDGNIRWDRLSSFSSSDLGVFISYARKTEIEGLDVGGNIKIIRRKAGDFGGSWGFGIDMAALYELNDWNFGLITKDITSTYNAWSFNTELLEDTWSQTGNELPENSVEITLPSMIPGISREFEIYNKFSALAEVNLLTNFDGKRNTLIKSDLISIDPRLGIELDYNKLVFLRAGLGGFQEIPYANEKNKYSVQPAIGAGINIRGLTINYALSNLGNSNNMYSHVFSLLYKFDINDAKSNK